MENERSYIEIEYSLQDREWIFKLTARDRIEHYIVACEVGHDFIDTLRKVTNSIRDQWSKKQ